MTLAGLQCVCNRATAAQIAAHLQACDADFVPPLSQRVDIDRYADKLAAHAVCVEAWDGGTLAALVAIYCNDTDTRRAHITSVSVLRRWTRQGVAAYLLSQAIAQARLAGMRRIDLEVGVANAAAIALYENFGFVRGATNAALLAMDMDLTHGDQA